MYCRYDYREKLIDVPLERWNFIKGVKYKVRKLIDIEIIRSELMKWFHTA